MKSLKAVLVAGCFAAFPALVFAQQDTQPQTEPQTQPESAQPQSETEMQTQRFQSVDKDSSGTLSQDEAKEAGVEDFAGADRNGDGEIDRSEFYLAMNQR